ncbi:MAG: TonB-dependent receptor [Pseudomonadota bacterium]
MKRFAISLSWIFCLFLSNPVLAGTLEAELPKGNIDSSIEEQIYFAEEELVTGPTKRPVPLIEAPANVTVITHEDIMQSGVTNLGEVFRRVAGMDVVTITAADTQVSARGFATHLIDGDRMAVLVDGRTFYLEFLGGSIWSTFPVPLSDIKRIEVIKGPMSSLYGNKAMLGIINIITYDPEETRTTLGGGGGRFRMAQGEFINAGKFADGYWYKISGSYNRSNEFSDTDNNGSSKDLEVLSIDGRLLFKPTDSTKIELCGNIAQNAFRLQLAGLSDWDGRSGVLEGNVDQGLGRWGNLRFQTYWKHVDFSSKTFVISSDVIDTIDSELRHSIPVDIGSHVKNTTTYGLNYRYVGSDSPSITDTLHNFAGFLQNETRFFDKVIFTGGVRVDHQKDYAGTDWSAQGSLVYLAHPHYSVRAGVATAFNTPTLIQYFSNYQFPTTFGAINQIQMTGNRNLNSERILYFEFANTIRPIDQLKIRADFFYYRLNNMITPTLAVVNPTTLRVSYLNDGGAEAIGGEIGIDAEIFSWLSAYASWSYEQFDAINGNTDPTANLGNPRHKSSSGLRAYFLNKRISANLNFNYVRQHMAQNGMINFTTTTSTRVDNLYLLNLRLGFWPIRDHLELAVAANNILNDDNPQTPAFDPNGQLVLAEQPKFNIRGSLRYVF